MLNFLNLQPSGFDDDEYTRLNIQTTMGFSSLIINYLYHIITAVEAEVAKGIQYNEM